jgi:hypothetical protein
MSSIASALKWGAARPGMPNHGALATGPKSIGLPMPMPLVRIA